MTGRDLGRLGEKTLEQWAAQVGMYAQKSDPDETGWDYFLELPAPSASQGAIRLPLDKIPYPIQCVIQVKSSDDKPGSWSVKLSNWRRLVESALPAFFLVLEFGGENSAQRGFLVHIGEEHISGTLKRLREMDPSEGADLHKKCRQFNYGEQDQLSSPDGKGLLEAIENHVGSLEDYISWKQESLRTVGYEGEKWKLNLVIPPPPTGIGAEEYLLDFALGLIPSIEVKNLEIRDVRFGIPSEEPTKVLAEAVIEIEKSAVGTGTLDIFI